MNWTRRQALMSVAAFLAFARPPTGHAGQGSSTMDDRVFELRQYTLRAGQRDTLITLFEREFIEPQNALGAFVRGTFRDLDDPDRFTWIRGFADMPTRKRALEAFYGGPIWAAHRWAANATMLDSNNVLLLRPAAIALAAGNPPGHAGGIDGIYTMTIHYLGSADAAQFGDFFRKAVLPRLAQLGACPQTLFETEPAANDFPRLPVRERDSVFAWLARWQGPAQHREFLESWAALGGWRDEAPDGVLPAFMRKAEVLRLVPTDRSELR